MPAHRFRTTPASGCVIPKATWCRLSWRTKSRRWACAPSATAARSRWPRPRAKPLGGGQGSPALPLACAPLQLGRAAFGAILWRGPGCACRIIAARLHRFHARSARKRYTCGVREIEGPGTTIRAGMSRASTTLASAGSTWMPAAMSGWLGCRPARDRSNYRLCTGRGGASPNPYDHRLHSGGRRMEPGIIRRRIRSTCGTAAARLLHRESRDRRIGSARTKVPQRLAKTTPRCWVISACSWRTSSTIRRTRRARCSASLPRRRERAQFRSVRPARSTGPCCFRRAMVRPTSRTIRGARHSEGSSRAARAWCPSTRADREHLLFSHGE